MVSVCLIIFLDISLTFSFIQLFFFLKNMTGWRVSIEKKKMNYSIAQDCSFSNLKQKSAFGLSPTVLENEGEIIKSCG